MILVSNLKLILNILKIKFTGLFDYKRLLIKWIFIVNVYDVSMNPDFIEGRKTRD